MKKVSTFVNWQFAEVGKEVPMRMRYKMPMAVLSLLLFVGCTDFREENFLHQKANKATIAREVEIGDYSDEDGATGWAGEEPVVLGIVKVRSGDSVGRFVRSKRFWTQGASVPATIVCNGLSSNARIRPGQALKICR